MTARIESRYGGWRIPCEYKRGVNLIKPDTHTYFRHLDRAIDVAISRGGGQRRDSVKMLGNGDVQVTYE